MNSVPTNLCKYLPPERLANVLGKLLIRFSQVSVMNDIEEFKPPISGLATETMLDEKLRDRAEALHPGLWELIEKQGPEYRAKLRKQAEQKLPQTIKTIYEMNDRNFGILSLSEDATNAYMWKRYADEGRGFLVEFDSSHSWFQQKITDDDDLRHLRRVTYVADRTPAYLLAITAQDYLYTKETKWEYEKEWRIILNFNSAALNFGKDPQGTDVLLFAIPPNCLVSVTVGHNASQEFVEKVRATIAANPSLSHVRLKAAKQREDGSIEIGDVESGASVRRTGEPNVLPLKIVILGWGSLIWDPRGLPREGTWQEGGPILPIEFSRVSNDCRLTLVIDPVNGAQAVTRYIQSPRADLDDAIADLKEREGTGSKQIGFVNLRNGRNRCIVHPPLVPVIQQWGAKHGVDGVIWTDLRSNFEDETGNPFTVERARDYLLGLSKSAADRARRYINNNNAPPDVDIPLRRQCRKLVGCNLVPTWFQRRAAKPAFFRYKRCRLNGFEVC